MDQYWKGKIGAGESIIIIEDFIEGQISFPNKNNYDTFNPIMDCEVTLKQYSFGDNDEDLCQEIKFPARKLRPLLKAIRRDSRNFKNLYCLDGKITITELEEFCELLYDLYLVFQEMVEKY